MHNDEVTCNRFCTCNNKFLFHNFVENVVRCCFGIVDFVSHMWSLSIRDNILNTCISLEFGRFFCIISPFDMKRARTYTYNEMDCIKQVTTHLFRERERERKVEKERRKTKTEKILIQVQKCLCIYKYGFLFAQMR